MIISRDTLALLLDAGIAPEKLSAIIHAIDADMATFTPPSKGATRTRRWREKREADATSGVTERHQTSPNVTQASLGDASQSVTKRHIPSPSDALTRVRDNLLDINLLEASALQTRDACADELDWPDAEPVSAAYLDKLKSALIEAAGDAINLTAPASHNLAPILALGRQGRGPRCELQADVLPAIRGCASRQRRQSIKAWAFFVPAITDARDQRLAGPPNVVELNLGKPHGRQPQSAKQSAREANLARSFAGAQDAARRRSALANGGG